RARAAEVRVGVVDAGVDDADLDALAGVTRALPDPGDAEVRHRHGVVELVGPGAVHSDNVGQLGDGRDRLGGEVDLHAVVGGLHLGLDLTALALERAGDGVLLLLQAALDARPLLAGELAALLGLDDGDGVALELDDDGHST